MIYSPGEYVWGYITSRPISTYFYPYLFTMALDSSHGEKIDSFIEKKSAVFVSLQPIAAPAYIYKRVV